MTDVAMLIVDLINAGTSAELVGRVAAALTERRGIDLVGEKRRAWDRQRAASYRRRGWRLSDREWGEISTQVYQRDGGACAYCGSTVGPFSIDHVVPVSRGGTHDLGNLVVACRRCNSVKGNRPVHEFVEGMRCR